ncbi:hypothetical protein [Halorubrum halodurans]|uniref:hypothetical protein n=1 Tax=Halorubrum halodurans TaxID=1383851 RepID=UPI0015C5C28E|nr:hypothetical protein [Halorubrum halodurans]
MDTDRADANAPDGESDGSEPDGSDSDDPAGEADRSGRDRSVIDRSVSDLTDSEAIEDWLEELFRNGRTNALIGWAMVAVLVGVFLESVLELDLLPMALVAAITAVVVAPAVAGRDPRVMPPWEVLVLALLPVLVRALLGGEVGVFATYLAIAALALVITVELQMFTSLRVTHWFAIVFVVMTTMATAAAWTVLRWNADRLLGTGYLTTNEALMIEWLYVTLAGLAAGVLFDVHFRRRGLRLRRVLRRVVRR